MAEVAVQHEEENVARSKDQENWEVRLNIETRRWSATMRKLRSFPDRGSLDT